MEIIKPGKALPVPPSPRNEWSFAYVQRIKEYLKQHYKHWYLDFEDITNNRLYCGYQVQTANGNIQQIIFVGKKLHAKIEIYRGDFY